MPVDSVSKQIRQNSFFFSLEQPFLESGNILYFATFSSGLEFLNEPEKEKNKGKGDSASVPPRFASLNNHF